MTTCSFFNNMFMLGQLGIQEFLTLVVDFIQLLGLALTTILKFSYVVGYIIVKYAIVVSTVFARMLEIFFVVLQIIYEDFFLFLHDVFEKLSFVAKVSIGFVYCFFNTTISYMRSVVDIILVGYELITSSTLSVYNNVMKVIRIVLGIPEMMKHVIIIIGNGIWLSLKLVPLGIVYISTMIVYLFGRCTEEISSFCQHVFKETLNIVNKIIHFGSDIPLESLLGLIVGGVVVILTIRYHSSLIHSLLHLVQRMYEQIGRIIYYVWNRIENLVLRIVTNQNQRVLPDDSEHSDSEESTHNDQGVVNAEESSSYTAHKLRRQLMEEQENKLCVVCQDQVKCIIIFPCRHLCLCANCSDILKQRNETCPICRQRVRRTMRVFV